MEVGVVSIMDLIIKLLIIMNLNYPLDPQDIKFRSIKIYKTKEHNVTPYNNLFKQKHIFVGYDPLENVYGILTIKIKKGNEKVPYKLSSILYEEPERYRDEESVKKHLRKEYKDHQLVVEANV